MTKRVGPHLYVEGRDDFLAITGIVRRSKLSFVEPHIPDGIRGWPDVRDAWAKAAKNPTAYPRLGLVVDADTDPASRWQAIQNELRSASGVVLPAIPTVGQGDIVTRHDGTRVGVWMMPDHKNPGELEDLLLKFVPAEDATWRVAQRAACVARALGASIKPGDLRKVELRTWLPWCDDPGATFQTAIMSGRLDAGVGGAGFVDWYVRVFGP